MTELRRITTEYIEAQDRIRLSGEVDDGHAVVLWLTGRLLGLVVPHLCQWLESQGPADTPHAAVGTLAQAIAQQAAQAGLEHQAPVRAPAQSQGWLVQAVDLTPADRLLTINFKTDRGGPPVARLALAPRPLRQWLSILHLQYRRGGWPLAVWPQWVLETAQAAALRAGDGVLH